MSFVCLALIAPACKQEESTITNAADVQLAKERVAAAYKKLEAGNYPEAERLFAEARSFDADNVAARNGRALKVVSALKKKEALQVVGQARKIAQRQGIPAALSSIERAMTLDPNHPQILELYGNSLAQVRQFSKARSIAKRLQQLYPGRHQGWWLECQIDHEMGDYQSSLALVDMIKSEFSAKEQPKSINQLQLIEAIAAIHHRRDRSELPLLRELIRRNPRAPAHRDRLASRLADLGEHKKALVHLKILCESEEAPLRLLLHMGLLQEKTGRLSDAQATFRRAATAPKGPGSAWSSMARVCSKSQDESDWRSGLSAVEKALSLNPKNVVALSSAAVIHRKLNQPKQASAFAKRQQEATDENAARLKDALVVKDRLGAQPENLELYLQYIQISIVRRDIAEARRTLDAGLRRWPKNSDLLSYSAQVFSESGAYDKSYWEAQEIVVGSPRDHRGLVLVALAAENLGRIEEAAHYAERAADLAPEDLYSLKILNRCYQRLGDRVEAAKHAKLRGLMDLK